MKAGEHPYTEQIAMDFLAPLSKREKAILDIAWKTISNAAWAAWSGVWPGQLTSSSFQR